MILNIESVMLTQNSSSLITFLAYTKIKILTVIMPLNMASSSLSMFITEQMIGYTTMKKNDPKSGRLRPDS